MKTSGKWEFKLGHSAKTTVSGVTMLIMSNYHGFMRIV